MNDLKKEVGEVIDRLATIYDEEDESRESVQKEISSLEERLYNLTGKTVKECEPFRSYWSYTDLDSVVEKILIPKIKKQDLSDGELTDIVKRIFNELGTLSEAELDRLINTLVTETGLSNISDYIFYPDTVGLDDNCDAEAVAGKILADRRNGTIYL